MLFTLGRSDGVSQGWFSTWLRMMGADGWFAGWLKAKEQYTGKTRRDLGLDESRIIGSMARAARKPSIDVGSVAEGLAALQLKVADKPYAPQLPDKPCLPQVVRCQAARSNRTHVEYNALHSQSVQVTHEADTSSVI